MAARQEQRAASRHSGCDEKIAALERALAEARRKITVLENHFSSACEEVDNQCVEVERLRAENERLQAVARYARHTQACDERSVSGCICGYTEAMGAIGRAALAPEAPETQEQAQDEYENEVIEATGGYPAAEPPATEKED
ncbi:MAG TPA: hypothetical protein VD948_08790 [Rhodothermales bacterium]|nr:hypothetical protein [Rhodothermales bacterium]